MTGFFLVNCFYEVAVQLFCHYYYCMRYYWWGYPCAVTWVYMVCLLSTGYLGNRLHSRQSLLLMCVDLVVVLSLFYSCPFGMVNTCLAPEHNLYIYPSNKYCYIITSIPK
jgi:hypothetical protein